MVPFGQMASDMKVDPLRLSGAQRTDVLCRCIVAALLVSRRVRRDTSFVGALAKPDWTTRVGEAFLRSLDGQLPEGAGPTGVLEVVGSELQMLYEDEHWVGTTLAQILAQESTELSPWPPSSSGRASLAAARASPAPRSAGWRRGSVSSLRDLLEGLLSSGAIPAAGDTGSAGACAAAGIGSLAGGVGLGNAGLGGGGETRLLVLREDARRTSREELQAARSEGAQRLVFVLGDHKGLKPPALGRIVADYGGRAVTMGPTPLLTSQCISALHYEMDRLWPASLSAEASWKGRFGFADHADEASRELWR